MTDVRELIEQLKEYDAAYAEGDSIVTDKEYDALYRKAQSLDPGNAYFASVGSDVRGGKEKLPYVMGSLDQIYDQKEWQNWVATYDLKDKNVIISDKQDGISAMLIYRNGVFEKAYSRGNGMEGADITRHVKSVPSVVKDISGYVGAEAYVAIRAELIMEIETFKNKYAKKFKNPRNMVAGCFNRSTTEESILNDIKCVTYQVVAYSGMPQGFSLISKEEELEFLISMGFKVTPFVKIRAGNLTESQLKVFVKTAKADSSTELDGIVVTINGYDDMSSQRRSKTTLNPEHSIKYKVSNDGVVTEVVDVLWEISKSGFFKPRVQIKPVDLSGVTITYATGFNAKFIYENQIGPGATVKITRAGDVIPQILEVLSPMK